MGWDSGVLWGPGRADECGRGLPSVLVTGEEAWSLHNPLEQVSGVMTVGIYHPSRIEPQTGTKMV